MKPVLLSVYDFFSVRKPLFYAITAVLFALLAIVASRINVEEDIARMLPNGAQTEQINRVLRHSRFYDRIIVKIKPDENALPDDMIALADSLESRLLQNYASHISELKVRVDDETALAIYNTVHLHLPIYLEETDYAKIDSLITPEAIANAMESNYATLTSASGMVMKRMIADDPVGISTLALRKLQLLQTDENFELYDGYIFSKDLKSLFLFITPSHGSSETKQNAELLDGLDGIIKTIQQQAPGTEILYYGGIPVAVGNARQLKEDTILTLSITVVSIVLFIGFFFRRKRVPLIMMLPVVFGGVFSLAVITLIKGSISSIALGAGSIILGIAVNYSLHFFSHYKHSGSIKETIADLISPMTIGSITTVGSFFSLTLLQSQILNDFGLFAGWSLVGATIFTLVFLPHFTPAYKTEKERNSETWLEKAIAFNMPYKSVFFLLIIGFTGFFLYHAKNVRFESDMNQFNFMNARMKKAQQEIDWMQSDTSKTVFIATTGKSTEEMFRQNETLLQQLEEAKQQGWIDKYSSISAFMPSEKRQRERLARWNSYWTAEKKTNLLATVRNEAKKFGFTANAFRSFENLLSKNYTVADEKDFEAIKTSFGNEYLLQSDSTFTVINAVTVDKTHREKLYAGLTANTTAIILDKQIITNKFIDIIYSDFNSILLYTSLLVFFALLFSYGRVELTLITFLPMLITWIWILGLMGLFGLHFNIINIIISTFIFGLGDDFSIFITDGLTRKFKEGKEVIASHRVSIFLAAITITFGLGALIFAKHPALRSIALISIIGIFCVLFIGQTVQPFLYNFFIQSRKEKAFPPWTIPTLILFWIAFGYYVTVCLVATLIGYMLLYLVPYPNIKKRKLFFHHIVCYALRVLTYMMVNVSKRHVGREQLDFSKPAVIIANHASFLDILVTVMQHPKLILLTNKWVYYSPVFGKVVQLADYYPVMEGVDPAIEKFVDIVKDGYSIVIFPEGTRSPDANLKRFHKGAFFLAEQLKLDIIPMLLHGTGDTIRKGDFMVMNAFMTMKFLPRISPDDKSFGEGYAERAKRISKYFKTEYEKLREENETPRYFRQRLRMNYMYKGAELEWLALQQRTKEDFYDALNKALPRTGIITELGCGYGFATYMMHFTGWKRNLIGIDHNEEKIDIANNCYSKSERINFICANVMQAEFPESDAIIINNENLLLNAEQLKQLIEKCFAKMKSGSNLLLIGNTDELQNFSTTKLFNNLYTINRT
ncbi:MAG: MMPL family transporter [Chitinophagales bacterium]|nr:MMPL family transporter [Chitinophagales bacterium]